MDLQPITIRRLAFIKYLYRLGLQQAETPEPLSSVSLLNFHDAVELFLQLACEHRNIDPGKRPEFADYLGTLKASLGRDLSQAEAMKRLNKARVSLKHHGIFPSKLEIEPFRGNTTSFFEDNTPLIFQIGFAVISLTDFVQPEKARNNLKEAEHLIGDGKLYEALGKAGIAFRQMLDDYESRKPDRFFPSPFFFGTDLSFYSSTHMGLDSGSFFVQSDPPHHHKYEHKLGEFIDLVRESLETMQEAIKILAMGIDYRRYAKFRFFTPYVYKVGMPEDYKFSEKIKLDYTEEDVRFCIEFVVESAVKLQEFDYNLPNYIR